MPTDASSEPHVVRCGPLYQLAQERTGRWRLWVDGTDYYSIWPHADTPFGAAAAAMCLLDGASGLMPSPQPKTGG
jgi:hypothetical protein